jgi:hypothetical protein
VAPHGRPPKQAAAGVASAASAQPATPSRSSSTGRKQ